MCVLSRCVGVRMACLYSSHCLLFFFFNDTATTEIYTLSLHDALPISITVIRPDLVVSALTGPVRAARGGTARSEEHTSELQSLRHLVCRLLLEKKKEDRYLRTRAHSNPLH